MPNSGGISFHLNNSSNLLHPSPNTHFASDPDTSSARAHKKNINAHPAHFRHKGYYATRFANNTSLPATLSARFVLRAIAQPQPPAIEPEPARARATNYSYKAPSKGRGSPLAVRVRLNLIARARQSSRGPIMRMARTLADLITKSH